MKKLALAAAFSFAATAAHTGGIEDPTTRAAIIREDPARTVVPGSRLLLPLVLFALVGTAAG